MNIPVLIVAGIMALAVLAHVFVGTKETATLRPSEPGAKETGHWVQAMCAFQMLSVDLLAVTAALFALGLYDLGPLKRPLTFGLAGLFLLWGIVWLVQAFWVQKSVRALVTLPHWIVWFPCAGLLAWAA